MLSINLASATPFIVGIVNDALDGTSANGRTIVLWNPAIGINDNVTDIVGTSGNSGADNYYFIDCALLSNGCNVGDNLRIQIFGERYSTNYTNITLNGAGFQAADNLTLNSPPIVNLSSPLNGANFTSNNLNFFCNISDYDGNLVNSSLYGNWSGGWHLNQTQSISGYSSNSSFTKFIPDGRYQWSCSATDSLSITSYSNINRTFTIDSTPPNISSIGLNLSGLVCGYNNILRVNCTVSDNFIGLNSVFIRAFNGSSFVDYSASFLSGNSYFSDISLDGFGEWKFGCYANDTFGNIANINSTNITVSSSAYDFSINPSMTFNPNLPVEGQNTLINSTILNLGCSSVENLLVGFYLGDPGSGGTQIGQNQTINISFSSNNSASVLWSALSGNSNIFVVADFNNYFSEYNESNNHFNFTKTLGAWQFFYGNITLDKLLSNSTNFNFTLWFNQTQPSGNVFIADTESVISWQDLIPFGKNTSLSDTTNDFADLDSILGMTNFNDSISNIYTTNGVNVRNVSNFLVYQRNLTSVPVFRTSISFETGLLWDSSDDTNGQYDQSDREDVVFVSNVNSSNQGLYGSYDYEINIPAKIREYDVTNSEQVYLYFDLN